MLLRMYTRWAERAATRSSLLERSAGEEAGIKSATMLIKGDNAYGWLKTEAACIAWCASRPMTAARATPASRRSGSIR
jgi:protein subunit release factor B